MPDRLLLREMAYRMDPVFGAVELSKKSQECNFLSELGIMPWPTKHSKRSLPGLDRRKESTFGRRNLLIVVR